MSLFLRLVTFTAVFVGLGAAFAASAGFGQKGIIASLFLGAIAFLMQLDKIDDPFILIVRIWLVAWTVGGVAIGNLAAGLPWWDTTLTALGMLIISGVVGYFLACIAASMVEKRAAELEDVRYAGIPLY